MLPAGLWLQVDEDRGSQHLQPYAKNAKAHGADQVAKIAASMAEFGWTVPCLVAEDGELIAGHGRVLAATQPGLTEAPVIVLGHLTDGAHDPTAEPDRPASLGDRSRWMGRSAKRRRSARPHAHRDARR